MPLYEAIINSIYAINDTKRTDGRVTVRIKREQVVVGLKDKYTMIRGFEIEDNGIGFNEANFNAFQTAETTYKIKIGGKGVGRFTWLKAFHKVKIESIFSDIGGNKKRVINFDLKNGIVEKSCVPTEEDINTIVKLIDFKEKYRSKEKAYKTPEKIAQRILEHFLSFYVLGNHPIILVEDDTSESAINLEELFLAIKNEMDIEKITIKNEEFNIFHLRLRSTYNQMNKIAYCSHFRKVFEERLEFSGESSLSDDKGETFYYACYVSSDYLDRHVEDSRDSFSIPRNEGDLDNYFADSNISLELIKREVRKRTDEKLNPFLAKIEEKKQQKLVDFTEKNPQVRRILSKFRKEILQNLKTNDSAEKINELIFVIKGKTEFERLQEKEKVLDSDINDKNIKRRIEEILTDIQESNKDQLIYYMVFRKAVIELLEKSVNFEENSGIAKEKVIHNLIFPMKTRSEDLDEDELKLWLIDEKLAYHSFASSDLPINQILEENPSKDRPDILICQDTQEGIIRSVCIIEFKRPFQIKDDPIEQLYDYVEEIRATQKFNGRNIRVNTDTLYYCYAICDVNESFIMKYVKNYGLTRLPLGTGFFTYNEGHRAFLEIRAYDKIIEDVIRRHKVFFEKLGIQQLSRSTSTYSMRLNVTGKNE